MLSLFGSIRLQLPVRQPIPTWPESETAIHTLDEKYGPLQQLLGKIPESLFPALGFFSHSLMKALLHLSLSPSVTLRGTRHLCWGELLFFHLKVYTKKRKKGFAHLARPSHLFTALFLPTPLSLPPPLQSLIPPQQPSPLSLPFPPSSFLPLSVCLSSSGSHGCVCVCRLNCWRCRISR